MQSVIVGRCPGVIIYYVLILVKVRGRDMMVMRKKVNVRFRKIRGSLYWQYEV